jgi:Domain of unknown function (DUF4124)
MVRVSLTVFLVLAPIAAAQNLQKWTTTEGKVYYGNNPPPGSVSEDARGSSPTDRVVRQDAERTPVSKCMIEAMTVEQYAHARSFMTLEQALQGVGEMDRPFVIEAYSSNAPAEVAKARHLLDLA